MKKHRNILIMLLFSATYFVSYLTRSNYAAVLVEMVSSEGLTKAGASLALTCSAITYGLGQILSGYLCDRLRPGRIILTGLLLATLMNISMAFSSSLVLISLIWSVNGFAQSLIWPPMARICAGIFNDDDYKKSIMLISIGGSIGTMCIYLFTPIVLTYLAWNWVFIISALAGLTVSAVWFVLMDKIGNSSVTVVKEQASKPVKFPAFAVLFLAEIIFAIAIQGALRDGIPTWLPTLMSESFNLGNKISILSGVVLPVFAMLSVYLITFITRKISKNEILCGAVSFFAAMLGLGIMFFFSSPVLSVIGAAIGVASIHAVNYCLICLVPLRFIKYNRTGFMCGLLNASTYIGSSVSGSGTALLADAVGWRYVSLVWLLLALLGCVVTLASMPLAKKFK